MTVGDIMNFNSKVGSMLVSGLVCIGLIILNYNDMTFWAKASKSFATLGIVVILADVVISVIKLKKSRSKS